MPDTDLCSLCGKDRAGAMFECPRCGAMPGKSGLHKEADVLYAAQRLGDGHSQEVVRRELIARGLTEDEADRKMADGMIAASEIAGANNRFNLMAGTAIVTGLVEILAGAVFCLLQAFTIITTVAQHGDRMMINLIGPGLVVFGFASLWFAWRRIRLKKE